MSLILPDCKIAIITLLIVQYLSLYSLSSSIKISFSNKYFTLASNENIIKYIGIIYWYSDRC